MSKQFKTAQEARKALGQLIVGIENFPYSLGGLSLAERKALPTTPDGKVVCLNRHSSEGQQGFAPNYRAGKSTPPHWQSSRTA